MIALRIILVLFPFCVDLVRCNPHWDYGGNKVGVYGGHDNYEKSGRHDGRNSRSHGRDCNGTTNKRSPVVDSGTSPDTRTLDDLYKIALAEGGRLVVYAGGDSPDQQDSNRAGFEEAFPGIKVDIVVDLSKYHDARIDYQLKTDTLVVDVAQLQTLHDFPRWRDEGVLLKYKPIGWDHIFNELKDPEGAYTGVFMDAFTTNVNTQLLPNNSSWPVEANDYLKPEFKDKLVVTYPNDDDAVLFWFKQVVDKYGFGYLDQFKAQNPKLVRGTATAIAMVGNSSQGYVATMSADGGLNAQEKYGTTVPRLIIPEKDPFVMWAQTAAIFKKAKNPETAKLYISWLIDKKQQEQPAAWSWSVRDDVSAPASFKSIWTYQNGNPTAFLKFMEDRDAVERFRTQLGLVFGQVQGPNPNEPNGPLGMRPVTGYRPATAPGAISATAPDAISTTAPGGISATAPDAILANAPPTAPAAIPAAAPAAISATAPAAISATAPAAFPDTTPAA